MSAITPRTVAQLRALSEDELVGLHDQMATETNRVIDDVRYYLEELARRESERRERLMVRLTWVITVFTAVNLLLVAAVLIRS
jgi:hypothetical protein